jgi:dephospho-CoA kinase
VSLIVGLTGGIGSGKSTVADRLAAFGAALVDTDVIAHQLTGAQGAAMGEIAAAFGTSVVRADGALDRAAMRRLVFSDPAAKERIEAILHPLIRRESEALCRSAVAAPYVLLVVPLLVEAVASESYRQRVDRILVVDCDEATQVSRVVARSGLSPAEVRAIMATQASRAERLAVADDVVSNGGEFDDLNPQLVALHRRYLDLAALSAKANIT